MPWSVLPFICFVRLQHQIFARRTASLQELRYTHPQTFFVLPRPGASSAADEHLSNSVGVDHTVAEDELAQRIGQRRQTHAADADPRGYEVAPT